MGLGDISVPGSVCTLRRSYNRSRKPSVKRWNFTYDERQKWQNKYTRLELKYYCWVASRQVFIFILKWIVYVAYCGLIWRLRFKGRDGENFLMTPLRQLKSEGSVLFKRIKYLISDGMNENKRLSQDSSFCEHRGRKHLPVSSIVFSRVGKKSFIQPHRLKALFKLLLILLFYSKPQNIFLRMNDF